MKNNTKLTLVGISALVVGIMPATGFYFLVSWLLSQVPATFAYAWLAKIGIVAGSIIVGFTPIIMLSIACGLAVAGILAFWLDIK